MANTPNIRFKGFTDAWEQRKFNDISEKLCVGFVGTCEKYYTDKAHGIPMYRTGNIKDGFLVEDDMKYVTRDFHEKNKKSQLKKNDILIARFGENGLGAQYLKDEEANCLNCIILRSNAQANAEYVKQYLSSDTFRKKAFANTVGSTFSILNTTTLGKMDIPFTSLSEQDAIAKFLSTLDNLITLHQRKCDETKSLKKYMLQKMFPKNGEQFPEIRFSGFTDAWEQRKVTELGEIYIGLVTTMTSHYTDHGALLIRNSDIKDGRFEFGDKPIYLDDEFAKQNASRKHKVGDVITVHTGDIGTSAVITEKEAGSIGFATIVTRPDKEKITSEYLCAYLNTDTHKNFAMNISTGDGRNNYNLKDYYECVVPVPSIAEQRKISSFIDELNNLITLQQRKCDELKEVKKYMLQNMFPKA